ncbi:MAG: shikimate kinase [Cyanobacteria bacterium SIG26]|nr:shikimate kinase [Cyanobacteria bacterium SIG26]
MKSIVLTGMMGCGKSTIGKILAEKLNTQILEIDNLIESQEKTTISEIFKTKGEKYFRQLEEKIILKKCNPENQIISLGGGAFENEKTRTYLLNNFVVIYLKTSPETIFNRVKNDTSRPLLCGNMNIENIKEILTNREQNYQTATYTIITDDKNPQDIINEIIGVL